jgi:hypothetical protein
MIQGDSVLAVLSSVMCLDVLTNEERGGLKVVGISRKVALQAIQR